MSDVRIADISVSRKHTQITLEKDGFYMEDLSSKFGSSVLVQSLIELKAEEI